MIKEQLQELAPNYNIINITSQTFNANIPYKSKDTKNILNYSSLIRAIEEMVQSKSIISFRVVSSNLEQIFNELVAPPTTAVNHISNGNAHINNESQKKIVDNDKMPIIPREKLTEFEIMKILLKKRFLHFKRNYRLILCVLILPIVFEILAMAFMNVRPPGEHDVDLQFSRGLYPNSQEVYSYEDSNGIENVIYEEFSSHCSANSRDEFGNTCKAFNTSEHLFRYVLNTTNDYPESRYGGISVNTSRSMIWYNNNGYHAMPVYLNEFNVAHLRALMNSSNYKITTSNHPLILGEKQLTTSSM